MESTRPAHENDRAACAALLGRALADVGAVRGGAMLVGDTTPDDLLTRWLHDAPPDAPPDAILSVGEFHHAIVGLAAATTFTRRGATVRSGRVECCYVEEGARGVGVGTALMDSLVAWCTEQGCRDIDALALPGDRHSKQRLEAAGFTARLLVLNRPLS
jgi:GNAT superfamily N-acetyltransferase